MVEDNEATPEAPAGARRRSRRAASRPAGPPVVHDPETPSEQTGVAGDAGPGDVETTPVLAASAEPAADTTPEPEPAASDEPEPAGDVEPEPAGDVETGADEPEAETEGEQASAPADVEVEGGESQPGEGSDSDAPVEQSEVEARAEKAATTSATAKKRPRRATRGVTTVAFSAEAEEEAPQAAPMAVEAPALALFQPPDETRAVRRRRTSGAASRKSGPADEATEQEQSTETLPVEGEDESAEPQAERAQDEGIASTEEETSGEGGAEADGEDSGEDAGDGAPRRRRRRGGRRRRRSGQGGPDQPGDGDDQAAEDSTSDEGDGDQQGAAEGEAAQAATGAEGDEESSSSRRRRRRRRRAGVAEEMEDLSSDDSDVVKVREGRSRGGDEITSVRGSTRIEAKKQRRRDGRDAGRRRAPILTEAEFLARRESVNRVMCVREHGDRTQIAVLEDGILVEHYVNRAQSSSMVGNVYLGKVQNVLPSMEAAFIDIGRGRNAVLYAGEVNWDAAGLEGQPKRIELALKSGDAVLVQVTKDPVGHKGARLTSQISLPGRFLVYVPEGSMTGISRKLPDTERARLKGILKDVVPEGAGVIVRTAAEGATEEQLTSDVHRLAAQWAEIQKKAGSTSPPSLLYGEPDLAIKVVRDIFNEDFTTLVVQGDSTWQTLRDYVEWVAPDLLGKLELWVGPGDLYAEYRIDEQLAKALDRKVWLPSGGSLVIDRTEAMTVVDVNTGKFTGQGGNLEETVTRNNLEAAEEIVRQLRLRDVGGIIVIDFIDMVLQSNRDLVLRRLVECLGRDRTKHQVAEVTSLGLVQMTRKRIGQGLLEVFSTPCEVCGGRGHTVSTEPVEVEEAVEERSRRGGDRGNRRSGRKAPVNLGGKQTGKTPPPPKFDENGHIDHASEEAAHEDEAPAPAEAGEVSEDVVEVEVVAEVVDPAPGVDAAHEDPRDDESTTPAEPTAESTPADEPAETDQAPSADEPAAPSEAAPAEETATAEPAPERSEAV